MEALSRQLTETLENSRRSQSETFMTILGPNSTVTDTYLKRMLLIVADSYECSAQNPTKAEKVSRAETWARVLFDVIPENRLRDCFDRAFRNRKSDGFPVSAYDLNDAWNEIQVEDEAELQRQKAEIREARPVEHCTMKANHINELGEIEILYGGPGGIEANVPCPFCRMNANAQAMANLAGRLAKRMPSNVTAIR